MSDNKQRYQQAKDAMAAGNYRKAQRLIGQMDHPKREAWLAQVEQAAERSSQPRKRRGLFALIGLGVVALLVIDNGDPDAICGGCAGGALRRVLRVTTMVLLLGGCALAVSMLVSHPIVLYPLF